MGAGSGSGSGSGSERGGAGAGTGAAGGGGDAVAFPADLAVARLSGAELARVPAKTGAPWATRAAPSWRDPDTSSCSGKTLFLHNFKDGSTEPSNRREERALSCRRCALRVAVRREKDCVCRCDALQCSTDVFALRRRECVTAAWSGAVSRATAPVSRPISRSDHRLPRVPLFLLVHLAAHRLQSELVDFDDFVGGARRDAWQRSRRRW
jgi:hypothetical protein